jgi:hypothetical protein
MTKDNPNSPKEIVIKCQLTVPKDALTNPTFRKFIMGDDEETKSLKTDEEIENFLKELGITDGKR